jgi:hypothetical protein
MASTYSPDLRIELIANGEQSGYWGTTTNNNLGTLIEEAIAKTVTATLTSAAPWFVATDGVSDTARCAAVVVSVNGTITADFTAYIPPVPKLYVVKNNSAYTMTLRNATGVNSSTSAGGTTIVIPTGKTVLVRSDGTNVVGQFDYIANDLTVGGTTNFVGNTTFGNTRLSASYAQGSGSTTATFTVANTYVGGTTVVYIATTSGTFPSGSYTVATASSTNFTVTATAPATAISGNALITDDAVTVNGVVNPGVIIDGSSTIPALRVTQTGSGNAFQVDDATNPDTTPFIIDNAGQIVTGYTAPLSAFSANVLTPRIQELGTDANGAAIGVAVFSTSAVSSFTAASLELARAYSTGQIGTFTAVPTDTLLGTVNFSAADGAKFRPVASIRGISAGAVSTTSAPGALSFSTIPALSTGIREQLRILSDGNIIIGSDEGTAAATGKIIRAANVGSLGDTAGPNFTIAAGNGTGTGGSGSIVLQTAPPTTSGTTQPTMVDRLTVLPSGLIAAKYGTMDTTTVPSEAVYRLGVDYVPTASTSQIAMFGVGIPVAANTTYEIDMSFVLKRTAGTTQHWIWMAFDIGSGTISSTNYWVNGYYVASSAALTYGPTAGTSGNALFGLIQTPAISLVTAALSVNPNAIFQARVTGTFTVGTAGTFTPKYLTSSSATVATGLAIGPYTTISGSYIKIRDLSATITGATNVGGWV